MTFIRRFSELSKEDLPLAGGKAANLGEMTRAGLPVPPGFVVTVDAWREFYRSTGIESDISRLLQQLDVDDPVHLRHTAESIQKIVRQAQIPEELSSPILHAYHKLSDDEHQQNASVAVRSSATVEDTAQFSFAGMFESFLNVRGSDDLLRSVKDCWASAYGARLLFYRVKQGLQQELAIAVIVQIMVDSEKSGVLFTVDPTSGDRERLVIEAAWGLGEVVVGGQVTPDRYLVDKKSLNILQKTPGRKDFMLVRDQHSGQTVRVDLPADRSAAPVLDDAEIRALSELARRDEAHYHAPQDAEWAVRDHTIYLVQTRPITTLGESKEMAATPEPGKLLLRGVGASPGIASGTVRVLESPSEAERLQAGEVLVTTRTAPDWVPLMRRAAAIVTDSGGMTSHAAIVSRELGIPCIVGARDATHILKDGVTVTVNARDGTVSEGVAPSTSTRAPAAPSTQPAARAAPSGPVTATRIYVNLGEPELAEQVAAEPVDGVGLLRAEFMILSALENTHPRLWLQQGRGDEFVDRLTDRLRVFARAFHPRPVVYRAMDFRSNEFRGLQGGEQFEPKEENPMIGYRGAYRYTREPDLFALELRAISEVRKDFPNLHLMIPFVRTGWEFRECKRQIDTSGLTADRRLELWVMAEVPSIAYWLGEYVRLGVTGLSIGSNDLTQLVLGVDRDSEILAPLYDERDGAVLDAIHRIIREARRLGITSSICGQAPSVYPEYAEILVRWGIDSISVNPDAIEATRRNVAAAEMKLMLDSARRTAAE